MGYDEGLSLLRLVAAATTAEEQREEARRIILTGNKACNQIKELGKTDG
jgi:hypothetical protein